MSAFGTLEISAWEMREAGTSDTRTGRDEREGAQAVCGVAAGDRWRPMPEAGGAGIGLSELGGLTC